MTRKDSARGRITADELRRVLAEDRDLLKVIVEEVLQQVLEAEMDEALQASKGERTASRLGYRSGYYSRTLATRVGKIALRVPSRDYQRRPRSSARVNRRAPACLCFRRPAEVGTILRCLGKPNPRLMSGVEVQSK